LRSELEKSLDAIQKLRGKLPKDLMDAKDGALAAKRELIEVVFDTVEDRWAITSNNSVNFWHNTNIRDGGRIRAGQLIGKIELKTDDFDLKRISGYSYDKMKYRTVSNKRRSWTIEAKADGRLFYVVDDSKCVLSGDIVAILANECDTKERVMAWYAEIKE
jgi:hypothetical protein